MIEQDIVLQVVKWGGAVLTVVGIWYKDVIAKKIGIKQARTDEQSAQLRNIQTNLDLYQEMVDDLDKRYKQKLLDIEISFKSTIDKLSLDINELKSMNTRLSSFIDEQKLIINKQRKSLDYYRNRYGDPEELKK